MILRSALRGDVDGVLDVWRQADAVPSATDDAPSLVRLLEVDPGALVLAEVDGALVGTLIATFDGWRANLYRLAVVPECRRRGVARALVEEGERRARARGARRFSALVLEAEAGAVGLWEAVGYERDPRITRFTKTQ
ncbi:MAG: GNAT family N-acetyltransferase [Acidimicrobiia bacterium]